MSNDVINLYSDTQTQPSPAMRNAMAQAPVGDEQSGLDPTVNQLCEMVANLLGKEAAVFLPSGTMCNEIALLVHCRKGDEIICDRTAHIVNSEGGGPAAFTGAMVNAIDGERGVFTAAEMEDRVRDNGRYSPSSSLVVIEQTSNFGGGTIWPLATVREVARAARRSQLSVHMDGARLMNAVVASGVGADAYAEMMDSVWIDLSKGLGCPVGAVLAGSTEFVDSAWRWKQRMGGAMRQAGIIAAAGVYALEHNVERLAEDHDNAKRFAQIIADSDVIAVDPDAVETNIVFFDLSGATIDAPKLAERLLQRGVRMGAMGRTLMRAVTHLNIDRTQVERAAQAVCEATHPNP
ncbi:MAG: threonine aldolase family protein [Gammaproteobacteria bacterium]